MANQVIHSLVSQLNSDIAAKLIYDTAHIIAKQCAHVYVLTFYGATIAEITTAINSISLPTNQIRNVVWNFTSFKPCVISINGTSATFIDAESWTPISDTSTTIHGEIVIM